MSMIYLRVKGTIVITALQVQLLAVPRLDFTGPPVKSGKNNLKKNKIFYPLILLPEKWRLRITAYRL